MEGGLLQRKLLEGTDLIKSIFQEKIFSVDCIMKLDT